MSGGNAKKKSSTSTGRHFLKKKVTVQVPSNASASSPETAPRRSPPKKDKAQPRRKKSGMSSESTARSHSAKSAISEVKTDSMMTRKPTVPKKVFKEKTKSDEKAPVYNSSSSSSVRSESKSVRAEILTRKKKSKPVSCDDNSVAERREKRKGSNEPSKQPKSGSKETVTACEEGSSPVSIRNQTQRVKEFARMCNQLTMDELTEQFNGLPDPSKADCRAYLDPRNVDKNRYSNIYCLDRSRVLLRFLESEGTYIHANRVEYETLKNPFIITQGPLNKTVNDFWRMVWQERSEFIVMLCKVTEDGRKKTMEYIPREEGEVQLYGSLRVKTCMRDSENGLITTRLTVDYKDRQRVVIHYQMTEWSDCRAPVNCVRQMFLLLKNIRSSSFPSIVHCSAGIGRSGTLVALEMCLMDLASGIPVNVDSVVRSLRRFRCHAVQTFEQYLSIYKFILLFGEQNECVTQAEVARFNRMFQEYSNNL